MILPPDCAASRPDASRWPTCAGLVACLLALTTQPPTAKGGDAPAPPTGSLVIAGGGSIPDDVRQRFLDLAGGKKARLVVIPTASELAHTSGVFKAFDYWKPQPAASVRLLHTVDRAKADSADFIKPLTEATGVWLGGGDQSRLIAAYRGTAVERELRHLLDRGGVVGGTSAGAAAMSALMILSGNPEAKVGDGLGLVEDLVIDQHFQNRNRL